MALVQDAAASYDLIVPSDRMVTSLSHLGLLAELKLDSILDISSAQAKVKAD
jgi:hypothetical protein